MDQFNKRCKDCGRPFQAGRQFCNQKCRETHADTLRRFGVDPATGRKIKPVGVPA